MELSIEEGNKNLEVGDFVLINIGYLIFVFAQLCKMKEKYYGVKKRYEKIKYDIIKQKESILNDIEIIEKEIAEKSQIKNKIFINNNEKRENLLKKIGEEIKEAQEIVKDVEKSTEFKEKMKIIDEKQVEYDQINLNIEKEPLKIGEEIKKMENQKKNYYKKLEGYNDNIELGNNLLEELEEYKI